MALTERQQRLEAIDALLDDYAVLVAETRARISWMSDSIGQTERALADTDQLDTAASRTVALGELTEFRGLLQHRLAVYRHYRRMLIERRAEVVRNP